MSDHYSSTGRQLDHQEEDKRARKLFIGGVSFNTTDEEFFKYFAKFGELEDCVLIREKETGQSRGFGFVTFMNKDVSEHVVQQQLYLDGRRLDPKPSVSRHNMDQIQQPVHDHANVHKNVYANNLQQSEHTLEEQPRIQTSKMFVGGLHPGTTEAEMSDHFGAFGELVEINIMYDRFTNSPRGFGFITFKDAETATKVITWEQGHIVHGKRVDCKPATARKDTFRPPQDDRYQPRDNRYPSSSSRYPYSNSRERDTRYHDPSDDYNRRHHPHHPQHADPYAAMGAPLATAPAYGYAYPPPPPAYGRPSAIGYEQQPPPPPAHYGAPYGYPPPPPRQHQHAAHAYGAPPQQYVQAATHPHYDPYYRPAPITSAANAAVTAASGDAAAAAANAVLASATGTTSGTAANVAGTTSVAAGSAEAVQTQQQQSSDAQTSQQVPPPPPPQQQQAGPTVTTTSTVKTNGEVNGAQQMYDYAYATAPVAAYAAAAHAPYDPHAAAVGGAGRYDYYAQYGQVGAGGVVGGGGAAKGMKGAALAPPVAPKGDVGGHSAGGTGYGAARGSKANNSSADKRYSAY